MLGSTLTVGEDGDEDDDWIDIPMHVSFISILQCRFVGSLL